MTVIRGPGGYGFYMLGSDQPIDLSPERIRAILERPGILDDISSAFDSPASTVDDWISVIDRQQWMADDAVRGYAGDGPLITDDEPRPEYFLLRGLNDILAGSTLVTAMKGLLNSRRSEAFGLAFDGKQAKQAPTTGFEFRLYRGEGTKAWSASTFGDEDLTITNVYMDVRPVEIKQFSIEALTQ